MVEAEINKYFSGGFSFIDIGGGNGIFADKILKQYPLSKGIVLDREQSLLNLNQAHPRKIIVNDSIENVANYITEPVDIVFFNWVLHHLVSDTYSSTIQNITQALSTAKQIKSTKGFISVFENMYNGLLFDNLPSDLIFSLTSNKLLAPIIKKRGQIQLVVGCVFYRKKHGSTCFRKMTIKSLRQRMTVCGSRHSLVKYFFT